MILRLLLAAGCCWIASSAHAVEPHGYWLGAADAPTPTTLDGGGVIHAAALAKLLRREHAVVLDVSAAQLPPPSLAPGAPWLPLPHQGIAGALWIPGLGAGELTPELDNFYRSRLELATGGDLEVAVIVYCHTKCWLSWNAAKRAIDYGYRHVLWFSAGIEGWTQAAQPTVALEPLGPNAVPAAPSAATGQAASRPKLLVLDLELTGDLGGPEFTAEHDARLQLESARLRQGLEHSGLYALIDSGPAQATLDKLRSQQAYLHDCNGCDLDVGRQLQADLVFVCWVDRVSGLILSLTYEIHDVKTSQISARKSFDFRGDSDIAWNHAIDYMVRDLKNSAAVAAPR